MADKGLEGVRIGLHKRQGSADMLPMDAYGCVVLATVSKVLKWNSSIECALRCTDPLHNANKYFNC